MKNYPPLAELRKEFSTNKLIPSRYEEFILKALSHYPELKETPIHFKLKENHPVPYGTSPAISTLMKPAHKRTYVVSILEKEKPPIEQALFKNLPPPARIGVIAHELGHVLQFMKQSLPGVMKTALRFSSQEQTREIERGADISAIEHGLGFELYTHARYIRTIPGYVQVRKEIEINYLHPHEILESIPPEELHQSHL
jgi:hypothetical protein